MWPYTKEESLWLSAPDRYSEDLSPEALSAHIAEAHRLRSLAVRVHARKIARLVRRSLSGVMSMAKSLTEARTAFWARNRTPKAMH